MKRQIRRGIFESNSSSTHSLIICSEEEFNAWMKGDVLLDEWGKENFVPVTELNNTDKENAEKEYETRKDMFSKDWKDLSDTAKEKYYEKYIKNHHLIDEDLKTYVQYGYGDNLEYFEQRYTSKNGDKIVAFGKYGTDY